MLLEKEKTQKVSLVSLGCDKNLVDGEGMMGLVGKEGFEITKDESESDVIIINTCGFLMDATSESIEHILRLAKYKTEGSCKALIVTGCMAQRYKEDIFKELPEVDAVVGTSQFHEISRVIKETLAGNQRAYLADKNTPTPDDFYLMRKPTESYFAYLKISEGCDKNCTYCTIPSIKGKYRSRTIESLVAEATMLAEQGIKELILVAQDSALYGTDIYEENRLHILLQELSKVEGIRWMRILYAYPEHITEETIYELANNPKVLPYLDMPIQHSNDFILKRMGRGTSNADLRSIIGNLRAKIPNMVIRTTVIVGFPGETEEYFNDLQQFLTDIKFDRLGVFSYSKEEGTPAAKLPNQIDEEIKQKRKNIIMDLQETISNENLQNKIGEVIETVVEKKYGENSYLGRTYMDCFEIDGHVSFDSELDLQIGDFVDVKITHSLSHDLVGQIVEQ